MQQNASFFEKLATLIVDKRNVIFFLYIIAIIASLITKDWVAVNDDRTAYLPKTTETRQGLTIMDEEMTTYATARIMISHVTYEIARDLADQMEEIDGISSVDFLEEQADPNTSKTPATAYKTLEDYMQGTNALIEVSFRGESQDESVKAALEEIKVLLADYDTYIDTEVGYQKSDILGSEMNIILVISAVIIILVLLFTSRSYAEVPVLLVTFIAAALLNKGTNFVFGEISYVSDSVTVVLQLALAIDYSIILLHRFLEEREQAGNDREACITALAVSIPSISASSLTTISGLAAMMFMQFRIGFDLGCVLIKAICFSMLCVFTLMPGLLMISSRAMEKTKHKNFIPHIDRWGKLVYKLRFVGVPVFVICVIAGFFLSNQCPYVYGDTAIMTEQRNEHQAARDKINGIFGSQNIMALLVPKGSPEKEQAMLAELNVLSEVTYAMGLSNIEARPGYFLQDSLTPRQFSEMMDLPYEEACLLYAAYTVEKNDDYGPIISGIDTYQVPVMDMILFIHEEKEKGIVTLNAQDEADIDDAYLQITDAQKQLLGDQYTRIVIDLDLPEEGEETFAYLKKIHAIAEKYYAASNVYLVGNSTSDYDQSVSFAHDNIMISVLSVVFVVLVLLFTFMSVWLPILLILVIQGSIWINFSFPTLTDTNIFFMSYLIVTAIQMGANIDYAIVISSWYTELKKDLSPKEAIIKALDLSFPTVLTSGSILSAAGYLIGKISSEPSIVGIGQCISRGTIISMFLVMFILPQILVLGDRLVEKSRLNLRLASHIPMQRLNGAVLINGRVRGRISGMVDAEIHGVIHGDVSAIMASGNFKKLDEETESAIEDILEKNAEKNDILPDKPEDLSDRKEVPHDEK